MRGVLPMCRDKFGHADRNRLWSHRAVVVLLFFVQLCDAFNQTRVQCAHLYGRVGGFCADLCHEVNGDLVSPVAGVAVSQSAYKYER